MRKKEMLKMYSFYLDQIRVWTVLVEKKFVPLTSTSTTNLVLIELIISLK